MSEHNFVTIDRKQIPIEGERNLLELIRKAHIDLPTFCYHSELSVYGACRLCMVDVAGKGLVSACSTLPEADMHVRTTTEEIRNMRKIIVELLLAGHEQACPTCFKSANCQLQNLARKLGIQTVRFKQRKPRVPLDMSSDSLVRDPNKCVLCGDCVRICSEVQTVGCIDFAYRGAQAMVMPCFGKDLGSVECVNCGQCSRVCPTGAITPKSEVPRVWKVLDDPNLLVVAQVAPAVRVAIGEQFGLDAGASAAGRMAAALRAMGFARVFDTAFTADLTVVEETHEFLRRFEKKEHLPQFTSCCPAWVKFAEQYYPELLANLSSCRSPQQMFGSLCKEMLSAQTGVSRDRIIVVSIMPCTAKKYEARRPEFEQDGIRHVDYVLTTQELGQMIEEAGLHFRELVPESFDMPYGFKTGAGIIFGNSGGVSEAVLRLAVEKLTGSKIENPVFQETRGQDEARELFLDVQGTPVRLAIVSGLGNARKLIEKVKSGEAQYDFVEVMACSGGCIGGAGQPVYRDPSVKRQRTNGLYKCETMQQLHKAQDNPFINELYATYFKEAGSPKAHHLLHTHYNFRKRTFDEGVAVHSADAAEVKPVEVSVCFGTSCFLRGSQKLMAGLLDHIRQRDLGHGVDVRASFCFEQCDRGPTVKINNDVLERCTIEKALTTLDKELAAQRKE